MSCPDLEGSLSAGGTKSGSQYRRSWNPFPDAEFARITQIATEDRAAREMVFTGTHTGPLITPEGPIPPTGRRVTLRQVAIHRIANGLVALEHVYYDQVEFTARVCAFLRATRAWGKRSAGSGKSGRRDGLPLAFNHAGRSQLCHAIPEPGGHGRTREDTTSSAIEYTRTRKEPPGHGRTHRCAGSGP
jgi:predicted ester cyclase